MSIISTWPVTQRLTDAKAVSVHSKEGERERAITILGSKARLAVPWQTDCSWRIILGQVWMEQNLFSPVQEFPPTKIGIANETIDRDLW